MGQRARKRKLKSGQNKEHGSKKACCPESDKNLVSIASGSAVNTTQESSTKELNIGPSVNHETAEGNKNSIDEHIEKTKKEDNPCYARVEMLKACADAMTVDMKSEKYCKEVKGSIYQPRQENVISVSHEMEHIAHSEKVINTIVIVEVEEARLEDKNVLGLTRNGIISDKNQCNNIQTNGESLEKLKTKMLTSDKATVSGIKDFETEEEEEQMDTTARLVDTQNLKDKTLAGDGCDDEGDKEDHGVDEGADQGVVSTLPGTSVTSEVPGVIESADCVVSEPVVGEGFAVEVEPKLQPGTSVYVSEAVAVVSEPVVVEDVVSKTTHQPEKCSEHDSLIVSESDVRLEEDIAMDGHVGSETEAHLEACPSMDALIGCETVPNLETEPELNLHNEGRLCSTISQNGQAALPTVVNNASLYDSLDALLEAGMPGDSVTKGGQGPSIASLDHGAVDTGITEGAISSIEGDMTSSQLADIDWNSQFPSDSPAEQNRGLQQAAISPVTVMNGEDEPGETTPDKRAQVQLSGETTAEKGSHCSGDPTRDTEALLSREMTLGKGEAVSGETTLVKEAPVPGELSLEKGEATPVKVALVSGERTPLCRHEDGSAIVRGLIQELSQMNKLLLWTKRDIETSRRQRQK